MTPNQSNTAVLIFSRSAAEEAALKRFAPSEGHRTNVAIANQFISHTKDVAEQSGLPVLYCGAAQQVGHSFAERFANAMEWAYAQGYERIVSIGSDCPSLSADILVETAASVKAGKTVLGPAADGGVYMIGLHQKDYAREAFMSLSWESASLLESWLTQASDLGQVLAFTSLAADVDDSTDFEEFLFSVNPNCAFALRLLALIHVLLANTGHEPNSQLLCSAVPVDFLRGPPRMAA